MKQNKVEEKGATKGKSLDEQREGGLWGQPYQSKDYMPTRTQHQSHHQHQQEQQMLRQQQQREQQILRQQQRRQQREQQPQPPHAEQQEPGPLSEERKQLLTSAKGEIKVNKHEQMQYCKILENKNLHFFYFGRNPKNNLGGQDHQQGLNLLHTYGQLKISLNLAI